MKICFISSSVNGGFGSFLKNTTSILLKHNVQVDILYINNKLNILDERIKCMYLDYQFIDPRDDFHRFKLINLIYYSKRVFSRMFPSKTSARNITLFKYQLATYYSIKRTEKIIDLSDYDCVVSAEEVFTNYFLANNVKAKRKIGFIHPDYKEAGFSKYVDKVMLRKLDNICCVSKSNAISLKQSIKSIKKKVVGIPNLIDIDSILFRGYLKCEDIHFNKTVTNIVTVCRLDNTSKALDRATKIAYILKEKGYKFIWRVIGEGYYREQLENLITKYGIEDCFILLGFRNNPLPYVRLSDLFVLQSYYEGYPISVCEALVLNVPCLITNFKSAKELIVDDEDGIIADNNIDDIVSKLELLLSNNNFEINRIKQMLEHKSKIGYSNPELLISVCKGVYNEKDY